MIGDVDDLAAEEEVYSDRFEDYGADSYEYPSDPDHITHEDPGVEVENEEEDHEIIQSAPTVDVEAVVSNNEEHDDLSHNNIEIPSELDDKQPHAHHPNNIEGQHNPQSQSQSQEEVEEAVDLHLPAPAHEIDFEAEDLLSVYTSSTYSNNHHQDNHHHHDNHHYDNNYHDYHHDDQYEREPSPAPAEPSPPPPPPAVSMNTVDQSLDIMEREIDAMQRDLLTEDPRAFLARTLAQLQIDPLDNYSLSSQPAPQQHHMIEANHGDSHLHDDTHDNHSIISHEFPRPVTPPRNQSHVIAEVDLRLDPVQTTLAYFQPFLLAARYQEDSTLRGLRAHKQLHTVCARHEETLLYAIFQMYGGADSVIVKTIK
jgi:hypothetical protein